MTAINELIVKINNESTDSEVRVLDPYFSINWHYDKSVISVPDGQGSLLEQTFVEQSNYQVQVGYSNALLGSNGFTADIIDTGVVQSSKGQHICKSPRFVRGNVYYGQVKINDEAGQTSGWKTFSFRYNALPTVVSLSLSPSSPAVGTDLTLNYTYSDSDNDTESGTYIRWFRNGVHERTFDDSTFVQGTELQPGDEWYADIVPSDGYEFGRRSTTSKVNVLNDINTVEAEGVRVLPEQPNTNDILRAEYIFKGKEDRSAIRWYVNDLLQSDFNDVREPRLNVEENDRVYFTITPSDGFTSGTMLTSSNVVIKKAPYVVDNIRVEGRREPYSVLTLQPIITWLLQSSGQRNPDQIILRIGTAPGSDNILTKTFSGQIAKYQVEPSILNRGSDYWVSIAAIDSGDTPEYSISHFRTVGSRWSSTVDNQQGWTFEAAFSLDSESDFDDSRYHSIFFQDGTYFGEVRIFSDRIGFKSSDELLYSNPIDLSGIKTITVAAKNSNLKVYVDRQQVIDATGHYIRESASRKLQIGIPAGLESPLAVSFASVFYTTDRDYYPGKDSEFNDFIFYTYIDFPGNEITSVEGYTRGLSNDRLIGLNPHDENTGGSIVRLTSGLPVRYNTVNRTFSPINNISISSNQQYAVFAHARGAAIFNSYYIPRYDYDLQFNSIANMPEKQNWSLVQNIGSDVATLKDGLTIDTLFTNVGKVNKS